MAQINAMSPNNPVATAKKLIDQVGGSQGSTNTAGNIGDNDINAASTPQAAGPEALNSNQQPPLQAGLGNQLSATA